MKRSLTTKDLVFVGVFAAMCAIGTSIKVPFGVGAMVHLGSGVIFTIAILYGGVYAGLAGAIGSALFDITMGFSPYTLWSFVIKGSGGFLAGTIANGIWPTNVLPEKSWIWRAIAGCVAGALWILGGYILAWWQVTGSLTIAIGNAPSSLMTSSAGLIMAILLASRLRRRITFK